MSKWLNSDGVSHLISLIKGAFKPKQTAITTDPSSDGSGTTFVDSVKQDANGVITVHRKTVQNASASQGGLMSSTAYSKLSGIESGAQAHKAPTTAEVKSAGGVTQVKIGNTAYDPASGIVSLPSYPTTLPASDVSSWAKAQSKPTYTASEVGAIATTAKGAANGVASLDANGLVPSSQLPSYVDDVIELAGISNTLPQTSAGYTVGDLFYMEGTERQLIYTAIEDNKWSPGGTTPESGKIYVNKADNKTYRWSGSTMVVISETLALGTTSSTAYRGDRGNTAYTHATDSNRLTTAKSEALYKIATTAEGHIKSVTAVQKSDITALGIPGSNTDTKVTSAANHYDPSRDTNADKSASASGATAAWSIDVVKGVTLQTDGKGHVTGVAVTSGKIPANPNTDTKVTSAANHYAPSRDTNADKSASASGATAAWSIDVVKGVTLQTDGKGHVTGVSVTSGKIPANPNTDTKVTSVDNHYTPSADNNSQLTAVISGTAGEYAVNTEYVVLTGVKAQRDAKGHVTGLTYTAQKIKGPDLTYTYNKPESGIPKSDLAAAVQASLDKADKIYVTDFTVGELTASTLTSGTKEKLAAFDTLVNTEDTTPMKGKVMLIPNGTEGYVIADISHLAGSTLDFSFLYNGTYYHVNGDTARPRNYTVTKLVLNAIPKTQLASAVQTSLGKADSALQSHQTIKQNGISGATRNNYASCSTAAGTAAKTADVTNGTVTLEAGLHVFVKFSNANTAASPTLNINSKGAKSIYYDGVVIGSSATANEKALLSGMCEFEYDGSAWHLLGKQAALTNSEIETLWNAAS